MDGESIGEKILLDAAGSVLFKTANIDDALLSRMKTIAANSNKSGITTIGETRVMLDLQVERPHLILIGGVHVSIPLQAMATQVGFRVSIVDPRAAFASEQALPRRSEYLAHLPRQGIAATRPGPQHLSCCFDT